MDHIRTALHTLLLVGGLLAYAQAHATTRCYTNCYDNGAGGSNCITTCN